MNPNNSNDTMSKLLNLVCNKLDEISNARDLNTTLVNEIDALVDIKKDILEIQAMEAYSNNEYENGYSQRGMNGNSYAMRPMYAYDHRYGYPQADQRYYNELMNGAYSRSDGMNNMNGSNTNTGNYSMNNMNGTNGMNGMNGYSRDSAETEMMNMLQNMANSANSNEKREMYHRFMNEMERMK